MQKYTVHTTTLIGRADNRRLGLKGKRNLGKVRLSGLDTVGRRPDGLYTSRIREWGSGSRGGSIHFAINLEPFDQTN